MTADALSEVLKTVRLTGATFYNVAAPAPWVVESPPGETILPKILPGAEHLIAYHVVTEGRLFANIIGEHPFELEAGEIIVFTKGDPHVLSSCPGMRADAATSNGIEYFNASQLPFSINCSSGNSPPSAKFVCGYFACDTWPLNPLLTNLPSIIRARHKQDGGDSWLGQFIRAAMMETTANRAGGQSVLAKLSELMFMEVVRQQLEHLPPEQAGWLAGLRDPFVGKALSLIHGRPSHNWTIEELGRDAGICRSGLAGRFASLVGVPPMQYLTSWRMQVASAMLSNGNANVAAIAAEVGYGSEASFSRAFKKMVGVPPSEWRQRPAKSAAG